LVPASRPHPRSRPRTGATAARPAPGATIGIDTGGTFTDLIRRSGDELSVAKVPSTPDDPVRAIRAGLEALGGLGRRDHVVHGTTLALNALLTGRVADAAWIGGTGLQDVLEIGRQDRPDIYALEPSRPTPLIPGERCFEVDSRAWPGPDGAGLERISRPTRADLDRLARDVARSGAESLAIGLLHAYAAPELEHEIARALRPLGLPITCSADLLREHREVERFSTAAVNAVLVPLMQRYLARVEPALADLAGAPVRFSLLQSTGGTLPAAEAAQAPVRVLLSGPAGGVVGAARAAREAGFEAFVGLDMGGTSTDVAFHSSAPVGSRGAQQTFEPMRVAGHPVAVPMLDIHTVGCGGGSLVTVDAAGILHVGPESAGADPGPVAYGRSEALTVTDAHVLLGHVAAGPFLGGNLELDVAAVRRAFAGLARRLDVDATDAARAVLDVARAAMRRALAVMTMQRGHDPARLPLVAFGGAGGLHAAALAESLGMPGALVPRHPGALSALGMTVATPHVDVEETRLVPLADCGPRERRAILANLERSARSALRAAGVPARAITCEAALDLRYEGQSFELRVPATGAPETAFHAAHERLYGYALRDRSIELVCLRVRAQARASHSPSRRPRARALPQRAVRETRPVVFARRGRSRTPVVERARLPEGCAFAGPALIEEYTGTTLVPPGWSVRVTAGGHLWLTPAG
jgi:N-methylhydantoinase A